VRDGDMLAISKGMMQKMPHQDQESRGLSPEDKPCLRPGKAKGQLVFIKLRASGKGAPSTHQKNILGQVWA